MTSTIGLNPDPPTQGDSCTVTYTGTLPRVLNLTWTPAGAGPATIEITTKGGSVLPIPDNGVTVKLVDPTGDADAVWRVISTP